MDWSESVAVDGCVDVWIAGGGTFVDGVRDWQSLHGLDEATAHRISIELMSHTAGLFRSMFPNWPLLVDIQQLHSLDALTTPSVVFDCRKWAINNPALESSWETTSDSIALQLATGVSASHLFLLKSKTPSSDQLTDAIVENLLDTNFFTVRNTSTQLKVLITNLRQSNEAFELNWCSN